MDLITFPRTQSPPSGSEITWSRYLNPSPISPARSVRSPSAVPETPNPGSTTDALVRFFSFAQSRDYNSPDSRALRLPQNPVEGTAMFNFLQSLQCIELMRLSSAARDMTEYVDNYLLQQIILESSLTITTAFDEKRSSDYQHLTPILPSATVEGHVDFEKLIVFEIEESNVRHAYLYSKHETAEIVLRIPKTKEYTWTLTNRDKARGLDGIPYKLTRLIDVDFRPSIDSEAITDSAKIDCHHFGRSDVEINVYYKRDDEDPSICRLHRAEMTLLSIRRWLSRKPGELVDTLAL